VLVHYQTVLANRTHLEAVSASECIVCARQVTNLKPLTHYIAPRSSVEGEAIRTAESIAESHGTSAPSSDEQKTQPAAAQPSIPFSVPPVVPAVASSEEKAVPPTPVADRVAQAIATTGASSTVPVAAADATSDSGSQGEGEVDALPSNPPPLASAPSETTLIGITLFGPREEKEEGKDGVSEGSAVASTATSSPQSGANDAPSSVAGVTTPQHRPQQHPALNRSISNPLDVESKLPEQIPPLIRTFSISVARKLSAIEFYGIYIFLYERKPPASLTEQLQGDNEAAAAASTSSIAPSQSSLASEESKDSAPASTTVAPQAEPAGAGPASAAAACAVAEAEARADAAAVATPIPEADADKSTHSEPSEPVPEQGESKSVEQTESKCLEDDDGLCTICFLNTVDVSLPCAHQYCQECIEDWYARDPTCPHCRQRLVPDEKGNPPLTSLLGVQLKFRPQPEPEKSEEQNGRRRRYEWEYEEDEYYGSDYGDDYFREEENYEEHNEEYNEENNDAPRENDGEVPPLLDDGTPVAASAPTNPADPETGSRVSSQPQASTTTSANLADAINEGWDVIDAGDISSFINETLQRLSKVMESRPCIRLPN